LVWGCSESEENLKTKKDVAKKEIVNDTPVVKEDLIEVFGTTYTEYYDAAKSKIKFQGEQDEEKRRHGKWVHYFENGTEASMTFYTNGIRNGFSSVKRPNGAMYYHGEYKDDKPAGIWKYYDEKGVFTHEQNYDEL
jgi:antitoxin component YwqK of YwqJK toxin-antitoxin module